MEATPGDYIPLAGRADADPGDEVQRNFRYQHAYGVILLLGAARGELPYTALWCEHHEDFIATRNDGRHDAYQIKTAQPENGAWDWNANGLRDSVKRFAQLQNDRPGAIHEFKFVSNVRCLDSHAKGKATKSPARLLERIKSGIVDDLYAEAFARLQDHCACSEDDLRYVLSRLSLVLGPGRDTFHQEISQEHLAATNQCSTMTTAQLRTTLDRLIDVITRASSLAISDGSKHWWPTDTADAADPYLRGKRVAVTAVVDVLTDLAAAPFRFVPTSLKLQLDGKGITSKLERKLTRGGLAEYIDVVRSRAISAERHLIELVSRRPENEAIVNQIEEIVNGECQEAHLDASMDGSVDGRRMLSDVHRRLRAVAETRPAMVHHEQYEVLAGVAGLLTEECRVWWSEVFDLGDAT